MTRDERQSLSIKRWKAFQGKGTIEACTGYGKTWCALKIIKVLVSKKPDLSIIVVVPTTTLKEQWESHINNIGCNQNCRVFVINSAIKEKYNCDLLVLDEEHRYASETFKTIFECVQYKLILGLTATFERLDGKHELIKEYCPICDTITLVEAEANGWVSPYTEYLVLIEVDNIKEYQEINTKFNEAFEFFNNDFPLCMSLKGPDGWKAQLALRDTICPRGTDEERLQVLRNIKIMSAQFGRTLQARKKFINYHPKKLEITRQIIDNRPDSKIITFSNTIEMADSIKRGLVYSGRDSKKKGRATLEQVRNGEVRVLNTVAKANEGLSIDDISVAIILGLDSSKTKSIQRTGRVLRKQEGKKAEIFNIIIKDTVELTWFQKSHSSLNYTIIDEEGLEQVLRGETPKPYKKPLKQLMFRF